MEFSVAFSDYALALCALLGTLLVPFFVVYQMLRARRRAVHVTAPAAPRGNRR